MSVARAREHLEELLKLPAEERSSAAEELLASLESDEVVLPRRH